MNELSTEQKKSAYVAITKTISLFTLMFPHHNLLCWIRGSIHAHLCQPDKDKELGHVVSQWGWVEGFCKEQSG